MCSLGDGFESDMKNYVFIWFFILIYLSIFLHFKCIIIITNIVLLE